MIDERPPSGPWWHHRRPQTDAERLQYAALTWTPDEAMERARFVRDHYPELLPLMGETVRLGLAIYESKRQAAVDAGRAVPDMSPERIAELDAAAAEFEATRELPAEHVGLDKRHRAAFRAAVDKPDMDAAMREWKAWLRDVAERNTFVERQIACGRALLGRGLSDKRLEEPDYTREMAQAAGGAIPWSGVGDPGLMVGGRS